MCIRYLPVNIDIQDEEFSVNRTQNKQIKLTTIMVIVMLLLQSSFMAIIFYGYFSTMHKLERLEILNTVDQVNELMGDLKHIIPDLIKLYFHIEQFFWEYRHFEVDSRNFMNATLIYLNYFNNTCKNLN